MEGGVDPAPFLLQEPLAIHRPGRRARGYQRDPVGAVPVWGTERGTRDGRVGTVSGESYDAPCSDATHPFIREGGTAHRGQEPL